MQVQTIRNSNSTIALFILEHQNLNKQTKKTFESVKGFPYIVSVIIDVVVNDA